MKNDKLILSAYASHNAAVSMFYKGKYWVVELERFCNSKNIGLCNYMPVRQMQLVFDQVTEWLLAQTDRTDVDTYITGYMNDKYITPKFKYKETLGVDHHMAHAACAFYQSPYQEALVISTDGGGDGRFMTVNLACKSKGIERIDSFSKDLGFAYMILADYMEEIKKESLTIGNLVYAGKLMGLCGYGKVKDEWMPHFMKFYDRFTYGGDNYVGGSETRNSAVLELMTNIGIENFDLETTRFKGEISETLAACTQLAFEETFLKYVKPYLDKYPNLPICLSGGCALNIILNSRLAKMRNGKVFTPPNPNDCGVSIGQLLAYQKPEIQVDLTYSGLPIMDEYELGTYLEDRTYSTIENVTLKELANYVANGFTVGFIQGNSEHGPRALGNRSIIANPGTPGMKDHINGWKRREKFRPISPICKLEDVQRYFDFPAEESRHMTFVADVREEWKEKLAATTHADGTGRLQTVTRWQNEAIYDFLTEFEKITGYGVIVNTSLNVNGKPILTRYSDALQILRETKMDAVYIHERQLIIFKNGDEKKFNKSMESGGLSPYVLETTTNIMAFPKNREEMTNKFIPKLNKLSSKLDKLVVITASEYYQDLYNEFKDHTNVKIYTFDNTKHYYNSRIHNKIKNMENVKDYDINSTYFFSLFIKPLWMKEVIKDNVFNTKYHLFIDLSLDDNYNYNIVRDIRLLTEVAKDETDIVGISAFKNGSSIFSTEFLEKKFKLLPDFYPTPFIYYGNLDTLEFFSRDYEGQFLWFLEQYEKVGTSADYCLMGYCDKRHQYKFLELEKAETPEI